MNVRSLLFRTNLPPATALVTTFIRIITGLILVGVSLSKFTRHDEVAASFERYGIPLPDISVYLAGLIEGVGGLFLIFGLLTRLAALVIAGNMTVAVLTGGRIDVDFFHTGLGLILLAAAVYLVWSGAGRWALDSALASSADEES